MPSNPATAALNAEFKADRAALKEALDALQAAQEHALAGSTIAAVWHAGQAHAIADTIKRLDVARDDLRIRAFRIAADQITALKGS